MSRSVATRQASTFSPLSINSVHCGNCHTLLKSIDDDSIDVIITSPPYFQQREYTGVGIGMEYSVVDYLDALLESFVEMVRVIKPTGHILYNLGDKINGKKGTLLIPYQFAIAATNQCPKVSLLNHIVWMKTNPTPRQFTRRLVSCHEPFFHFVKSTDYYYCPEQFMAAPKQQKLIPPRNPGQAYFTKIAASQLSPKEKKSAVRDLEAVIAEVKSGHIASFRMKIRGVHAPAFGGQEGGRNTQMQNRGYTIIRIHGNPMKKDALVFPVESIAGCPHPAVFPLSLIRELIKLSCPPGGIVLDPYCGSGTTLVAAKKERRNYVGIDIGAKYCAYARQRVKFA